MFLRNKMAGSLLRKSILISSPNCHHHDRLFSALFRFSSSTAVGIQNPPPKPHFMVEYLINSCGFSPERANTSSKHLTGLKSTSKPDSILDFLRQSGFSDARITKLLSKCPRVLSNNVDKTLKPKLTALREMGFSDSEIIQLASDNPSAIVLGDVRPKIQFWRSILGTNANLLKAFRRDNYLITASLANTIVPNLSLLRERGVPDCQISNILMTIPRLVGRNPNSFKALVDWVEELGFSGHSGIFCQAIHFVASNTRAAFRTKVELLKSLGWTEVGVMSAFRKQPRMFNLTEEHLRRKVEFFVEEVGFDVSSLVCNPALLSLSLERRLRPRLSVLRLLKRDEMQVAKIDDFKMIEETFMKRYVIPHKEKVPELEEAYVAARAGAEEDTEFEEDTGLEEDYYVDPEVEQLQAMEL